MYIEANVHGNEIQGAEVSLYTIWYLMEHYDRMPQIKQLVDERVFYIVPTVNPDGREHFLKGRRRRAHGPRARWTTTTTASPTRTTSTTSTATA